MSRLYMLTRKQNLVLVFEFFSVFMFRYNLFRFRYAKFEFVIIAVNKFQVKMLFQISTTCWYRGEGARERKPKTFFVEKKSRIR